MKNILIINSFYSPHIRGGAEIICQEQAETLAKQGYNISVLTTADKDIKIKSEYVNNIKVYRVGIKNIYWPSNKKKHSGLHRFLWHIKDIYNYSMRPYIREIIKRENPNIVICHNITGFSISIWDEIKKYNIPIIQVLHDQYLKCPNSNGFKNNKICKGQCLLCKIMRLPHRKKSNNIDAVVGVSKFVLTSLSQLDYFKNIPQYVIHNARYIPDTNFPITWDGNSTLKFGYIGTLSKVKGVEWLINTFLELKDINATLTIAGKGESKEYESYLHSLANGDKRIKFVGYVKSTDFYKNIHVSIIPSLWPDTFPGVTYESCAYHVPVITTNNGGIPEVIKDNTNGIICNPQNKSSLKYAILKCYNNPEFICNLSTQARKSVYEMLDVEMNIKKYISIINIVQNNFK